jgi:hypothetical protein
MDKFLALSSRADATSLSPHLDESITLEARPVLPTDRKWIIVTQLSSSRIENTYGFLGRSQGMDEASIKNSFAEYRKTVTTRQS